MTKDEPKTKLEKILLFNCTVIHNKEHHIPMNAVSEKEIILLRTTFGDEAVPDDKIVPHIDPKTKEQAYVEKDTRLHLFEIAKKYANTADPMSGKRKVEKVFSVLLVGYEKWLEELVELDQMEREERHERANREAHERTIAAARAALQPQGQPA